ncbi:MAG TPA: VOC family protein [Blastocatellia bacterium]|nr:VOC family protein [Blastocatellia bacterium]
MLTGIDHIVIVVPDLDLATKNYQQLGFTVVAGGRHSSATHNALIGLADGSYLELIAFYEPSPEHRWWRSFERGGGLTDVCLRTDNLRAATIAFRRAGIDMSDPEPMGRTRPDGFELRWVLSVPLRISGAAREHESHNSDPSLLVPFLIEDETPREERVPRQIHHANGVTGIRSLTAAAGELTAVRSVYSTLLGQPGQEVECPDLNAAGVSFRIGTSGLAFLSPKQAASALAGYLEEVGSGIYSLLLASSGVDESGGPLASTGSWYLGPNLPDQRHQDV